MTATTTAAATAATSFHIATGRQTTSQLKTWIVRFSSLGPIAPFNMIDWENTHQLGTGIDAFPPTFVVMGIGHFNHIIRGHRQITVVTGFVGPETFAPNVRAGPVFLFDSKGSTGTGTQHCGDF